MRRLGKHAAKPAHPQLLSATRDALAALPPAPAATSWTTPGEVWPMFCNDVHSCCTATTMATGSLHMTRVAQCPTATPWADSAVLGLYADTSGWNPAEPSVNDNGAYLSDVAAYMASKGIDIGQQAPEVFTRVLPIDPSDEDALARAIATFGWVAVGWQLTQAMFDSADGVWDYVAGSPVIGGHATAIVDTRTVNGSRQFKIPTWSKEYWATSACVKQSMDEAYLVASREHWTNTDYRTPLGTTFDEALSLAARIAAS